MNFHRYLKMSYRGHISCSVRSENILLHIYSRILQDQVRSHLAIMSMTVICHLLRIDRNRKASLKHAMAMSVQGKPSTCAPGPCFRLHFIRCKSPNCFPILLCVKYNVKDYVWWFSCPYCFNAEQTRSTEFFNPATALYSGAQVNSSIIANIHLLICTSQ